MSVVDGMLESNQPMMITVTVMNMVENTINQVIKMITMRHLGMSTVFSVSVVLACVFTSSACSRVGVGNSNDVLIVVTIVRAMQMIVVKVSHMTIMNDGGVSAVGSVCV